MELIKNAHALYRDDGPLTPRWRVNKHGDPIFLLHIMNVNYAKFQKKFDSRTISRELP